MSSNAKKFWVIFQQRLATCMPSQSKCLAREENVYVPELGGVAELADNKGFTEYAKKTESDQTNH